MCNILELDINKLKPRTHKIKDHPRPFRGGLSVRKAERMGMKIYSAADGLKAIKREL